MVTNLFMKSRKGINPLDSISKVYCILGWKDFNCLLQQLNSFHPNIQYTVDSSLTIVKVSSA